MCGWFKHINGDLIPHWTTVQHYSTVWVLDQDSQYCVTNYDITLHFLLPAVPPPTVIVQSDNPDLALVAGTLRNLTCTVSLSTVDDIIIVVDFTWSINMSPISSSDRITTFLISQSGNQSVFTSTLMFNPLSSSTDSGEYDCSVDVSSYDDDLFIEPTNASNSTSIIVQCELL